MSNLLEQINALLQVCDEDECECIEEMIISAGNYVQAVVDMESKALNFARRAGEDFRSVVSSADSKRTNVHNGLISNVNIVNRICIMHDLPELYTGGIERREYGDFAQKLVNEIFTQRR